jgi:hypothetical protein
VQALASMPNGDLIVKSVRIVSTFIAVAIFGFVSITKAATTEHTFNVACIHTMSMTIIASRDSGNINTCCRALAAPSIGVVTVNPVVTSSRAEEGGNL